MREVTLLQSGGVVWCLKQGQISQTTICTRDLGFCWHREIVNQFEGPLREVNPPLSLHCCDWTQDLKGNPSFSKPDGDKCPNQFC